jgi:hypothetical protein
LKAEKAPTVSADCATENRKVERGSGERTDLTYNIFAVRALMSLFLRRPEAGREPDACR